MGQKTRRSREGASLLKDLLPLLYTAGVASRGPCIISPSALTQRPKWSCTRCRAEIDRPRAPRVPAALAPHCAVAYLWWVAPRELGVARLSVTGSVPPSPSPPWRATGVRPRADEASFSSRPWPSLSALAAARAWIGLVAGRPLGPSGEFRCRTVVGADRWPWATGISRLSHSYPWVVWCSVIHQPTAFKGLQRNPQPASEHLGVKSEKLASPAISNTPNYCTALHFRAHRHCQCYCRGRPRRTSVCALDLRSARSTLRDICIGGRHPNSIRSFRPPASHTPFSQPKRQHSV